MTTPVEVRVTTKSKELVESQVHQQGTLSQKPSPKGLGDVRDSLSSAATDQVAKKAKKKESTRSASQLPKLEPAHVEDFTFIFKTLAIEDVGGGLVSLTKNKTKLQAAEKRLDEGNLHPLSSMVLFATELKVHFQQVHTAFTTWWTITTITTILGANAWERFETDMVAKLEAHHDEGNIEVHLEEFCRHTKLNIEDIRGFVKERNWKDFIRHCLEIK